jgi:aryl-alcohol dehydrogenase-like predicted oxidoreductase
VVETLVRFKEEGKIGGFGFSEIAPFSLLRATALHPVRAVQNEYSLWTRQVELGLLQACARHGTAFVAFSPLARGMFGEPTPDPAKFSPGDFRIANPRFNAPHFEQNRTRVGAFLRLAREMGHAPASLAIAWTLARGDHVIPIPGTRSAAHLKLNAAGAAIRLSESDLQAIENVLPAGFAHGPRYSEQQFVGIEQYC